MTGVNIKSVTIVEPGEARRQMKVTLGLNSDAAPTVLLLEGMIGRSTKELTDFLMEAASTAVDIQVSIPSPIPLGDNP